jgi:hypothetical protein
VPTLRWEDAQRAALLNPADDPVLPEDSLLLRPGESEVPERPTIPLRTEPIAAETDAVVELVAVDNETFTAAADADSAAEVSETDIIVVEDDPPPPPTPPAPQPEQVRRQEYRQLFAKLRRR